MKKLRLWRGVVVFVLSVRLSGGTRSTLLTLRFSEVVTGKKLWSDSLSALIVHRAAMVTRIKMHCIGLTGLALLATKADWINVDPPLCEVFKGFGTTRHILCKFVVLKTCIECLPVFLLVKYTTLKYDHSPSG